MRNSDLRSLRQRARRRPLRRELVPRAFPDVVLSFLQIQTSAPSGVAGAGAPGASKEHDSDQDWWIGAPAAPIPCTRCAGGWPPDSSVNFSRETYLCPWPFSPSWWIRIWQLTFSHRDNSTLPLSSTFLCFTYFLFHLLISIRSADPASSLASGPGLGASDTRGNKQDTDLALQEYSVSVVGSFLPSLLFPSRFLISLLFFRFSG